MICLLFVIFSCWLDVRCWLLFVGCRLLVDVFVCCLAFVVYCVLFVVSCFLFARCLLLVVVSCFSLFVVRCVMFVA